MNNDNLLKYFNLLLHRDRTSDHMYDSISDMLDDIWYGFTEEELTYANELLAADRDQTRHTRITNILSILKENTMTTTQTHASVFDSKEDYQKLRTFWKQFHADGKHKAVKVEYRHSKPDRSGYGDGDVGYHMESPLTLRHHLIYLAAMGKSFEKAIGNSGHWTLRELGWAFNGAKRLYPETFNEVIDEKYHAEIIKRIKDYLNGAK